MSVSVASSRPIWRLAAPIKALVCLTLSREEKRAGELGVVLVDDASIRELNRRYRRHDRATDVLSFLYEEVKAAPARHTRHTRSTPGTRGRRPVVHGDIVISLDRMRHQARRYRVPEARELGRLVIHGALHLAGHDHQGASERRRMREREALVLSEGERHVAQLDRALRGRV
jgi:probable rRNA maturation factor